MMTDYFHSSLWVVTCFFNPMKSESRLTNYQRFRRGIKDLPLVCVELAFHDRFWLADDDADLMVRVHDGDLLWQKERLLNIAVDHLPKSCLYVAWLDADVWIEDPLWHQKSIQALSRYHLVRPFSHSVYLPESEGEDPGRNRQPLDETDRFAVDSYGFSFVPWRHYQPGTPFQDLRVPAKPWGKGWVARRELLTDCCLYDCLMVGGGDLAILFAAFGMFAEAADLLCLPEAHRHHYVQWSERFFARVEAKVGSLYGRVFHFWHGRLKDRRYGLRHQDFAVYDFSPYHDIVLGHDRCWKWSPGKPEMIKHVRNYFELRNEP